MAQNSLIQVRVDDAVKKEADILFNDLGLDTPTAIRMFLKQAIKQRGLPFEVAQNVPNAETRAALEDAERIARDPNTRRYSSVEELFRELDK